MILLESKFVNSDIKIYFGSRNDEHNDDENFLLNYLRDIYRITRINNFVLMKQIHSDNILHIKNKGFIEDREGIKYQIIKDIDGIYTGEPNIALCVKTADCMPVFIVAGETVAAIHMGWRGAQKLIVKKYLNHILLKNKVSPKDIFIIAGPHIRDCCYSVGKELVDLFEHTYKDVSGIFSKKDIKLYLSLENTLRIQAKMLSIPEENIYTLKLCTYCANHLFYSYRYEKLEYRRNISFIVKERG